MNNEMLYKGNIRVLKSNYTQTEGEEIIYRILNYKNLYFFAEEILTGCIFPTYSFYQEDNRDFIKDEMIFNKFSYNTRGKYYIYFPITQGDNIFEFKLASKESNSWKSAPNPTIEEVNKYIKNYSEDNGWKRHLKNMETHNQYYYTLQSIKNELKSIECQQNETINNESEICGIYTPIVDIDEIKEFGYDLSTREDLCNLIGREEETKQIIKGISIKNQSILIVGPSGSGKTSLVESLAVQIKKGTNKWLKNKLIFYVNIQSIIKGTSMRGSFEENFQKLINFCVKNKDNIILFIDEIHNLYGLGRTQDSSVDAMNILKPYIIKRDLTILGATTDREYQEYIAKDNAFENRFDKLTLKAPDEKTNIEIILSYIKELEIKYNIKLNLEYPMKQLIAEYIVNITDKKHQRVVGDIPVENIKLAKNIIEDAFVEAIYNSCNEVSIDEIILAIISCSKLSPKFRKEKAENLKNKILLSGDRNIKPLVLTKTI